MTLHKFLKAGKPSHKLELSGDDPDHKVKMDWVSCQVTLQYDRPV